MCLQSCPRAGNDIRLQLMGHINDTWKGHRQKFKNNQLFSVQRAMDSHRRRFCSIISSATNIPKDLRKSIRVSLNSGFHWHRHLSHICIQQDQLSQNLSILAQFIIIELKLRSAPCNRITYLKRRLICTLLIGSNRLTRIEVSFYFGNAMFHRNQITPQKTL